MKDGFDRTINYIRVSVTDRCNLRCSYCMPQEGIGQLSHGEILSFEENLRLFRVFARLGLTRVKITGGEPLVRKGTPEFIRELKKIPGIEQVTITTNGLALSENLTALIKAGIDGVNISLDTLNPEVFKELTGSPGLNKVLKAITDCAREGVYVKLNCVPIDGVNDGALAEIAAFARETVAAVRFIELMPIGFASRFSYISSERVMGIIEKAHGKLTPIVDELGNGPARYYRLNGFKGRIGVINAMSHAFCESCNRLRLTSDGRLLLCLSHGDGADLREPLRSGADDSELEKTIRGAVLRKPRMHVFLSAEDKGAESGVTMNSIGG